MNNRVYIIILVYIYQEYLKRVCFTLPRHREALLRNANYNFGQIPEESSLTNERDEIGRGRKFIFFQNVNTSFLSPVFSTVC